MKFIVYLALSFASIASYAQILSDTVYVPRSSSPVFCDKPHSRLVIENPSRQVSISDRSTVQALRIKPFNIELNSRDEIELNLSLQFVSCVLNSEGKRVWFAEDFDQKDYAEVITQTGLFNGEIFRTGFREFHVVDMESSEVRKYNLATFKIFIEKALTRSQVRKFNSGATVSTELKIGYGFTSHQSPLRPIIPFSVVENVYPAHFNLRLEFKKGVPEVKTLLTQ